MNRQNLYEGIAEFIELMQSDICERKNYPLGTASKTEKGHSRIDSRYVLATHDARWLYDRCKFEGIKTNRRHCNKSRNLLLDILQNTNQNKNFSPSHAKNGWWKVCIDSWDVIFGEGITTINNASTR
jgi:hypothetical protein